MTDDKWTVEKVRKEIYDARTKMFVVAKVLETGSVSLKDHEEWALVIKPLLRDLQTYVDKVTEFTDGPIEEQKK